MSPALPFRADMALVDVNVESPEQLNLHFMSARYPLPPGSQQFMMSRGVHVAALAGLLMAQPALRPTDAPDLVEVFMVTPRLGLFFFRPLGACEATTPLKVCWGEVVRDAAGAKRLELAPCPAHLCVGDLAQVASPAPLGVHLLEVDPTLQRALLDKGYQVLFHRGEL